MQTEQLEMYLQPAMLADHDKILAMNEKAQTLLPGLKPGQPLPEAFLCAEEESVWEGCACLEGRMYRLRGCREGEEFLYTIQPEAQTALSEGQLDGALYQMRALMSDFYRELAPCVREADRALTEENKDGVARSFDRMMRLLDHLDFLRDAQDETLKLALGDTELGRLCFTTAVECDGLLRETGVRVEFTGLPAPILVRADEGRLRDALMELISNCAKRRSGGGTIFLRLSKRGNRAIVTVTDDGPKATARQQMGMTACGAMPLIPAPDSGAGLGLSVAEKVVWLHGGALLFSAGEGAPRVYLSLPITKGGGACGVNTPRIERNAGRSPYIIAMSDVLPGSMIREDWME